MLIKEINTLFNDCANSTGMLQMTLCLQLPFTNQAQSNVIEHWCGHTLPVSN